MNNVCRTCESRCGKLFWGRLVRIQCVKVFARLLGHAHTRSGKFSPAFADTHTPIKESFSQAFSKAAPFASERQSNGAEPLSPRASGEMPRTPVPTDLGYSLIRRVTVLFAPTIASLREAAKRHEGSVEPERDRAAARRGTAIAVEGESGINGYRSLYSEHCPLSCERGGEASDIFCAALSFSHLRCQLPPGGSLGLSSFFIRWVTVLFAPNP